MCHPMQPLIYKVCSQAEWDNAVDQAAFHGSADDLRDGFIHLSTAEQLIGTLARHFSGARDLLLIGYDPKSFGNSLKWEASRSGQMFPHVYGVLPPAEALSIETLRLGADGQHILREGLRRC